jgi:hypothetical protein
MTTNPHVSITGISAWQRYLDREHEARDTYLAQVQRAHHEYLTGPWPDRAAYEVCERRAWMTYYAAGRTAWHHYSAEITSPPPPPAYGAASYLTRDAAGEVWPSDPPRNDQPGFTPTNGGADKWPSS